MNEFPRESRLKLFSYAVAALSKYSFGTGRNHVVHIHNRELNLLVEVASEPRVPSHSPAILSFRSGTVRREAKPKALTPHETKLKAEHWPQLRNFC